MCSATLWLRQPHVFALRQCRRNGWDNHHTEKPLLSGCFFHGSAVQRYPNQLRCHFTRDSVELSTGSLSARRVAAGLGMSTVQKNPKLWPVPGCSGTCVQWIGASQIQCLRRRTCINKVVNCKTWTRFWESSSSWRLRCFGRVVMGNRCLYWACFIETEPQPVTFHLAWSFLAVMVSGPVSCRAWVQRGGSQC